VHPDLKNGLPMRKALLPLIASLALCGTATVALIATNARADQSGRKPVMVALTTPGELAGPTAAPGSEGGPSPEMMRARDAHHEQMCKTMYAHKVGEMAFLEAKLSLSATQAPLFDRWKQTSLDIAKQRQADCAARQPHKPGERPSVVDRLTMEETALKKRLANIEAIRPALAAFYTSLTPAQKEEFGHGGMRHRGGRMHMMMGMMGGRPRPPEMGGHMGRGGPMGPAPMPPAPPQ
jgi:LTXXQ motif family protein